MPLNAVLPSVREDANTEELKQAYRQLIEILDEWLTAGLDSANLSTGGVSLGTGVGTAGNLKAVYVTGTTHAVADTEKALTHTLGRIPVGYMVIGRSNGGVVYDGTTAWTASAIYLKCTTTSNDVLLLVF